MNNLNHNSSKPIKFDFFHGTSSVFINSILKFGLGGINPNYDNKNLDTLSKLFNLSEKNLMDKQEFLKLYDTTKAMSLQAKLKVVRNGKEELLNFRHDGTYISLSVERAASYATLNKYGSEILCRIFNLMDLLDAYKIDYSKLDIPFEYLEQIKKSNHKPIIIHIKEVKEELLEKEDGKTAIESLNWLRSTYSTISKGLKYEFFQSCNFKLLEPVTAINLEIYEVDFEGKFGQPDYDFTMTKIKYSL
jgi:hypothetical protein